MKREKRGKIGMAGFREKGNTVASSQKMEIAARHVLREQSTLIALLATCKFCCSKARWSKWQVLLHTDHGTLRSTAVELY